MRFLSGVLIGACSVLVLAGCGTSSPVVATIGNEQLTLAEFEQSYAKNNGGLDSAANSKPEDWQRYLDLLVKFRMKVQEAHSQGLDRDSAVQAELDVYRASVAQSFLLERELVKPGLRRAYERQNQEVRASHILIRLAPGASPADTEAAYKKTAGLITRLANTPFDSLAHAYSEDPSAATNGGDLGYFNGGRMVAEFEDAVFDLKPGEYTKLPVRSQFGYHIIKVADRRPNPGSVHMGHILLRFSSDMHDTASVLDTAWTVYRKLKQGMAFGDAVRMYSQDPGSVPRDGDIGFFERSRLPAGMGDMFVHPPADSILEPFRMPYGFHLLKFLGYRPIPPFAEAEKELRTTYQGQRYQADYNRYLQQLARAYPVSVDSAVLKELSISFDTTKVSMADTWSDTLSASIRAKTLVTVGGRPTTVQQFADRITGSNQFRPTTLNPAAVLSMIPPLVENLVVEEHGRAVARRDPEFIALMKEYEDGILLYRIEQDELWKKIVLTDTLLQEYFTAHRDSYRWPDRVNFAEIYLPNDSLARMCAKELRSGKEFGAVVVAHSIRQQYVEKKGEWGLQPVAMNELTQRAALMRVDSVSEPFRFQNGWSIIKTIAKEESRLKTFEEAKPEVTTTYQDIAAKQREQQWLEELRAKHPIAIKGDVLREAFKRTPRDAR